MKKILFLTIFLIFIYGCSNAVVESTENQITSETLIETTNIVNEVENEINNEELETPFWMEIELEDVNTGENYKISDFNDKPVLVESFAVWCPTCTRQQSVIKKLHEEIGDDIISIALDTDPNENKDVILEHTQSNGFDWKYSVSPIELTQALIDEFGLSIVNAPSVPMVLICPNGNYHKLDNGVKQTDEILNEIKVNCDI